MDTLALDTDTLALATDTLALATDTLAHIHVTKSVGDVSPHIPSSSLT